MLSKYEARNELYHSNPNSKIGENAIRKTMREIVRVCEFSNWRRSTNHAGRALGITMMLETGGNDTIIARQSRHAGPQSMGPYKQNTKMMESDVQDNLMGSYLFHRFNEPTTKKPPPKKPPLPNTDTSQEPLLPNTDTP
jgi:integrase